MLRCRIFSDNPRVQHDNSGNNVPVELIHDRIQAVLILNLARIVLFMRRTGPPEPARPTRPYSAEDLGLLFFNPSEFFCLSLRRATSVNYVDYNHAKIG